MMKARTSPDEPSRVSPPLTPALAMARGAARGGLRLVLVLQLTRLVAGIGLAGCLAWLTGGLVEGGALEMRALAGAGGLLIAMTAFGWLAERATAAAEAKVAGAVLGEIERRLVGAPPSEIARLPRGALIAGIQRQPGALARLVVGQAAARRMMAAGPLIVAGAVVIVSWQAALALLLATPVMIVFFALVGGLIAERAHVQEAALGKLAAQFADRIRALPTILANGALAREEAKLGTRLEAYARGTMGVLAVAFLNAGVLDFFSSLAIAILAVFLGLGHLGLAEIPGFAHLALAQSLFILLLAPDYFAPFRRFAEQYHAKAEGEAAATALAWAFEPVAAREAAGAAAAGPEVFGARGLVLPHIGAVPDFDLPAAGLVAICGPSGAGKSTLLEVVGGLRRPGAGEVRGLGRPPHRIGSRDLAALMGWVPQNPEHGFLTTRVRDEIAATSRRIGVPVDVDAVLAHLRLDHLADVNPYRLSGGEQRRLTLGAALAHRPPVLLLDEPTVGQDRGTWAAVTGWMRAAAGAGAVVGAASHDADLVARADRVVPLDGGRNVVATPAEDAR